MGLHSGEHGVKSALIRLYPSVWNWYESLPAMVAGQCDSAEGVAHVIDGNVLMFGAPAAVRTLCEYEEYLFDRLLPFVESCALLIVCFDDPPHVPPAKHACQRQRDKSRAAPEMTISAELHSVMTAPSEEDCTRERMEELLDCRVMLADRAVRMRFIDEVCVRVFGDLILAVGARMEMGFSETAVLFDGFDAQGTTRPPHHPRDPHVFCTDVAIYEALQYHTPLGEADVKLNIYDQLVRRLAPPRLVALHTIDTDSLPISLLQQTKRLQERGGELEETRTVLCLRERGSSALRCVDIQRLCQALMVQCVSATHPFDPQEAMFAIACAWALGGCDFILPGAEMGTRPQLLFESMLLFLRDRGTQHFRHAHPGAAPEAHLHLLKSLRIFANVAAQHPDGTAQHKKKVERCDDDTLRKAIWTASYWRDVEFPSQCCNVLTWKAWGFPVDDSHKSPQNTADLHAPISGASLH